jgi:succinate dehydrogenase / fumarate reductase, flavoprotein subunit
MTSPTQVETDVLVIGAGGAGMYAAIEAARAGCRVLLIDRSLIGRGGATVMAQMTVAVALGEEAPDHWSHHLQRHARRRPRPVQRAAVAAAVRAGPRSCIREMDAWGVGWARKNGKITLRPSRRATTGRAASMSTSSTPGPRCRRRCARRHKHAGIRAWATCVVDRSSSTAARCAARWHALPDRRAGDDLRQGHDRRDRRADAALPAQQRLGQHGRRRLRARAARRAPS